MSDKDVLEQYNLVWIITDYDIDVVRLPQFAEEITIETEALTYNVFFATAALPFTMKMVKKSFIW